jgi:hypothetical protein
MYDSLTSEPLTEPAVPGRKRKRRKPKSET